jgi:predicted  nucleic acid-binding Zn-ribbon protein
VSDELRPEDLDTLLDLQRTDSRLARLQHLLDELPEQRTLDETLARIKQLELEQDETRVALAEAEPAVRQHEREIDVLVTRKEAEQARLYAGEITNPREHQALKAEIDGVERRIGEHEDDLLEAMERVEAVETAIAERDEVIEQLQRQAEAEATTRDEAASAHLAEKAELEVTRDKQRERIPDALLERYDAVRERVGGGVAVGELVDGACTACRIDMPMVEVRELQDGPPLTVCPECRRLLVVS